MIAGAMSQMAQSPIPGGRSFKEVTGDKTDIAVSLCVTPWRLR
jgi:hypothetical protein